MAEGITLSAPGKRELVKVAEAQTLVETWKQQCEGGKTVTKLSLSSRAWPSETLRVLGDFLTSVKAAETLEDVQLDDVIASLPTEDGLASLTYLGDLLAPTGVTSKIHTINLNQNATGIRGIRALRPLLSIPSLRHLHLHNNGLSAETIDELNSMLVHSGTCPLESIDLGRNQMGVEGARHAGLLIAQCPNLRHFLYAGSRPQPKGTGYLCEGLSKLHTLDGSNAKNKLETIDLNDCTLQDGSEEDHPLHNFMKAIQHASGLQILRLPDCELGPEGLERLVASLSEVTSLTELDLEANDALDEGTAVLADWLTQNPQNDLKSLNFNINEVELPVLLASLSEGCPKLEHLYLQGNDLDDDSWSESCIDALPKTLKTLDIQDNDEFSHATIRALDACVSKVLVDAHCREGMETGDAAGDGDDDALAQAFSQQARIE